MLSSYIELDWMMMIMVQLINDVQLVVGEGTLIEGAHCTFGRFVKFKTIKEFNCATYFGLD